LISLIAIPALFGGCGSSTDEAVMARWEDDFTLVEGTTDIPIPPGARLIGDDLIGVNRNVRIVLYLVPEVDTRTVHAFYDRTVSRTDPDRGAMSRLGWEQTSDIGTDMGFKNPDGMLLVSFEYLNLSGSKGSMVGTLVTFEILQ